MPATGKRLRGHRSWLAGVGQASREETAGEGLWSVPFYGAMGV